MGCFFKLKAVINFLPAERQVRQVISVGFKQPGSPSVNGEGGNRMNSKYKYQIVKVLVKFLNRAVKAENRERACAPRRVTM